MISERSPAELFAQASALFSRLRQLPDARRQGELEACCAGDTVLRREVEALLHEHVRLTDEPVATRDEATTLHRLPSPANLI